MNDKALSILSADTHPTVKLSMLNGLARRMEAAGRAIPELMATYGNALAERNTHAQGSETYRKLDRDAKRAFTTAQGLEHDIKHYQPCAKRAILGEAPNGPLYRALVRVAIEAKGDNLASIDHKDLSTAVTYAIKEGPTDTFQIIKERLFKALGVVPATKSQS